MAATPTTRSQVQAYRFVLRRMEHALVRKDAVMVHDPMRTQLRATAVGAVLGVLLLAGFALVSVFRPADDVSRDSILVGTTSLTTFVAMQENGVRVLHPVLNLASARLIAGEPAVASLVDDAALEGLPRGPLLGIPGAPDALPEPGERADAGWAVCDRIAGGVPERSPAADPDGVDTTVIGGSMAGGMRALGADDALFVRAPDGSAQLVFGGRRAAVNTEQAAVTRELGLTTVTARPVSAGFLNAVPEVPELAEPVVPDAGARPSYAIGDALVGDVVDVESVQGVEYYLVLADGVQPLEPLVAGLLVAGSGGFLDVGTDVMAAVPNSAAPMDLDRFPVRTPRLVDAETDPVACLRTEAPADPAEATVAPARGEVMVGPALPVPAGARVVPFVADPATGAGSAPMADGFYLRPGHGAVVQTTPGPGTRFLVSDTGPGTGSPTRPPPRSSDSASRPTSRRIRSSPCCPRARPWTRSRRCGHTTPSPRDPAARTGRSRRQCPCDGSAARCRAP